MVGQMSSVYLTNVVLNSVFLWPTLILEFMMTVDSRFWCEVMRLRVVILGDHGHIGESSRVTMDIEGGHLE